MRGVFCLGTIVRHKVKDLVELVQDDERLKQERKRAKKNRDKYRGVSSDDFTRKYSKCIIRLVITINNLVSLFFTVSA